MSFREHPQTYVRQFWAMKIRAGVSDRSDSWSQTALLWDGHGGNFISRSPSQFSASYLDNLGKKCSSAILPMNCPKGQECAPHNFHQIPTFPRLPSERWRNLRPSTSGWSRRSDAPTSLARRKYHRCDRRVAGRNFWTARVKVRLTAKISQINPEPDYPNKWSLFCFGEDSHVIYYPYWTYILYNIIASMICCYSRAKKIVDLFLFTYKCLADNSSIEKGRLARQRHRPNSAKQIWPTDLIVWHYCILAGLA